MLVQQKYTALKVWRLDDCSFGSTVELAVEKTMLSLPRDYSFDNSHQKGVHPWYVGTIPAVISSASLNGRNRLMVHTGNQLGRLCDAASTVLQLDLTIRSRGLPRREITLNGSGFRRSLGAVRIRSAHRSTRSCWSTAQSVVAAYGVAE